MPTSSQAMIVLTEEGTDPRIPRRHYHTNKNIFFTNIGDSDTSQTSKLPVLHTATSTSFQNIVNINDIHGTITYDSARQRLSFVEQSSRPVCVAPSSLSFQQPKVLEQYNRSTSPMIVNNTDEQERQRLRHESLGFRKRRLVVPEAAERKVYSANSIPAAAKFMPTPPGQKPRHLPDLIPNTFTSDYSSDSLTEHLAESFVPSVPTVKPKSLLEELKEAVSYEKRLFPALHMRSTLPLPSPNCACFSLRKNDEYSHADVLQLLREKTGLKPRTIRYDPVDVRSGNSEICSRWVVEFLNPDDTKTFIQNGLEVEGEKIIVKSLDEVHKMEYQAYRLKIEEERRLAERQARSFTARKTRRSRTKHGRV